MDYHPEGLAIASRIEDKLLARLNPDDPKFPVRRARALWKWKVKSFIFPGILGTAL